MHRLALIALAATLLAGCGGDGNGTPTGNDTSDLAVPWVDPDGDPPIVGGLSVNPADGALLMSTNTGMFRIAPGATKPKRFTGTLETPSGSGKLSEALVTRFVEPDTLLGSGHPSAGESLPPALGLIRSEDAGKTWTPVSELGKADFHAIQTSDNTIVAGRYGEPAIDVSTDGGKTFAGKRPPDPLVDLEVDPEDPKRWVATTQSGIFTSSDQGTTWRQRDPVPNSRLSWADGGALFRIDPGGPVKRSDDSGETWEAVGTTGGEPRALHAKNDKELYAVLLDGTVKQSTDAGATWTDRVTRPQS